MLGWELPPYNSGGLGVACYFLSKALSGHGVDIDFIVPYKASHKIKHMQVLSATEIDPLYKFGISAYDTKYLDEIIYSNINNEELMSIRDIQRCYIEFVDKYLIRNPLPDIVHAHDWLTLEAGMLAKNKYKIPLIAHVHATEFDRAGDQGGNPLVHEIEYQGMMLADRILAVSQATKDEIVDRYSIPADKIDVVYNGFDLNNYADSQISDENTYKYLEKMKEKGYTIISTIARFTVQKGLSHLIKAAAKAIQKYDKLIFLIAGDGEQRDELIQLAADYGISDHIIFTGFVRGKAWRDVYDISDVFVMSSVSEPFGLTALEAAHYGNALIISKQSGVGEILRSIFRYDFWDEDKLADEIIAVATSPVLMSNLKDHIKDEYARISWNNVAEKCLNSYNETLKKGK